MASGSTIERPPANRLHRFGRLGDIAEQDFGSLSCSSTDIQANAWPLRLGHCNSSVVLP
jgi:hypothetical protein